MDAMDDGARGASECREANGCQALAGEGVTGERTIRGPSASRCSALNTHLDAVNEPA